MPGPNLATLYSRADVIMLCLIETRIETVTTDATSYNERGEDDPKQPKQSKGYESKPRQ